MIDIDVDAKGDGKVKLSFPENDVPKEAAEEVTA